MNLTCDLSWRCLFKQCGASLHSALCEATKTGEPGEVSGLAKKGLDVNALIERRYAQYLPPQKGAKRLRSQLKATLSPIAQFTQGASRKEMEQVLDWQRDVRTLQR